MSKQKVLNFFAGPGVGKSTTAAGIFAMLKMRGYNIELVQEYAKELAWAGVDNIQEREVELIALQYQRMQRLIGKVDLIITDSPLLIPLAYCHPDILPIMRPLCTQLYSGEFDNYDYLLSRTKSYNPKGRFQTFEEAVEKDREIANVLKGADNPHAFWVARPPETAADLECWANIIEGVCGLHDSVRY